MEDEPHRRGSDWLTRACRVTALLLIGSAAAVWWRPSTVPGRNLQPFGCGSPAAPNRQALARLVCTEDWDRLRLVALALLVAGILVLALGEVYVALARPTGFRRGLVVGALLGVPALALAVARLLMPVVVHTADGTVLRCGSPVDRTSDAVMRAFCGQAADTPLYEAVAVAGLAAVVVVGTGYVFAAGRSTPPVAAAGPPDPEPGVRA